MGVEALVLGPVGGWSSGPARSMTDYDIGILTRHAVCVTVAATINQSRSVAAIEGRQTCAQS